MIIYIDSDFKCYTTNPNGNYREIETNSFDGKCQAFIEGCRYIPFGETWTREDGVIFGGGMTAPFEDSYLIEAYQRQYEADKQIENEALNILIGASISDT